MRQTVAATILAFSLTIPAFAARSTGPEPIDLTPQFRAAGVTIDKLQVLEVGGVVLLRGQAPDRASAEEVGRIAQTLGYTRVANLVKVVERADDAVIERAAERELAMHRSLDGCKFVVDADNGVLHVQGEVQNETQKDTAIAVLRTIDGVRVVDANLQRR